MPRVVTRLFTATHHPPGSPKRAELNLDWRTSEYMPSHRYGIVNDDGSTTPFTFRTRREAVSYLPRVTQVRA